MDWVLQKVELFPRLVQKMALFLGFVMFCRGAFDGWVYASDFGIGQGILGALVNGCFMSLYGGVSCLLGALIGCWVMGGSLEELKALMDEHFP